jgi:GntR family transcriptional repressor for pyruvate dehydrogenase complex
MMSNGFGKIVTTSIAKQIAVNIREAILQGRIGVDQRLPTESELAAQFEVSRPTIREALKRLAAENLVRSRRGPAGGNFVKKPSLEEVQQSLSNSMMLLVGLGDFSHDNIVETRLELESLCCRLATKYRTSAQLESMRREILIQENADISDVEFCASDVRFHIVLANASHNPLLAFLTSALLESLQPVTNLIVFRFRDRRRSALHHKRILQALEARDAKAAVSALTLQMAYIKKKYKEARQWSHEKVAVTPG